MNLTKRLPGFSKKVLKFLSTCLATLILPVNLAIAAPDTPKEEVSPVNKSAYNLFKPTPKEYMRKLNTDRPDKTEGPYTVDAGHFQLETDLLFFKQDRSDEGLNREYDINVMNLRLGLLDQLDLHVIFPTYVLTTTEAKAGNTNNSGFGDVTVRLKYNFFGNESDYALGLIPFLKLPTNTNNLGNRFLEGGLILPVNFALPYDFSAGAMLKWSYLLNDDNKTYGNEFVTSISIGHDIVKNLGAYFELYGSKNFAKTGFSDFIATFDVGVTYLITDNIQVDTGVNIGLTTPADDLNAFGGLSLRF